MAASHCGERRQALRLPCDHQLRRVMLQRTDLLYQRTEDDESQVVEPRVVQHVRDVLGGATVTDHVEATSAQWHPSRRQYGLSR